MKNVLTKICYVAMISSFLAGCSMSGSNLSPENMIDGAIKEQSLTDYYAEAEIKVIEDGNETISYIKEWRNKAGNVRMEARDEFDQLTDIVVNNGKELLTYNVNEKVVYQMNSIDMVELNDISPKELARKYLDLVVDSHDTEIENEEKMLDRNVVKVTAKSKDANSLIGDLEIWIDKKTHFVLRVVNKSNDSTIEVLYTKIDEQPKFTDNLFELDLPNDVEFVDLEDGLAEDEITLAEAREIIGEYLLVLPEETDISLAKITKVELEFEEIKRTEVNMDYEKDDLAYISISVFPSPEDIDIDTWTIPGEEKTEVRGLPGTMVDEEGFRNIFWQEEGLNYSVLIFDPALEMAEAIELLEELEFSI